MNRPYFSVLVPTYNQAHFLGEALDTLRAQTWGDWEAIVVNDGSTDDTQAVIERYRERDARIKVVHKANGGTGSALNEGLRQATGEWVCWLSSDDFFHPRKLEIHRRAIATNPDCRFFFTYSDLYDEVTGRTTRNPFWPPNADRAWQMLNMLRGNFVHGNSICVERAAWLRTGYFDESLRFAQDYDMWLRLMVQNPATLIPEPTCITRYHAAQGTHRFPEACQFDSAKAAIKLLNCITFEQLIPCIDLEDRRQAMSATAKALNVASDTEGFLYALGPQPGLIWRMIEWAWNITDPLTASKVQTVIRAWAYDIFSQYQDSLFGAFWHSLIVEDSESLRKPCFHTLSAVQLAERYLYFLKRVGDERALAVERYLCEFEGREAGTSMPMIVGEAGTPGLGGVRTAMTRRGRWIPTSAVKAAVRCPDLWRSGAWWSGAARSTVAGQTATKLAKAILDPASPERQGLHQLAQRAPQLGRWWNAA